MNENLIKRFRKDGLIVDAMESFYKHLDECPQCKQGDVLCTSGELLHTAYTREVASNQRNMIAQIHQSKTAPK